jgi:hypothetical protein
MNAERLNNILFEIGQDVDQYTLPSLLQSFVSSFAQNITQPNDQNSNAFLSSKEALKNALKECKSNYFSHSQRNIVAEIGGEGFVGNSLMIALGKTIEENLDVPGQALSKVQEYIKKTNNFFTTVKMSNKYLDELGLKYDFTKEGEYEIGIIIPTELFNNNLEDLGKEIKQVDQHIKTFGELAENETSSPTIRSFSSGSLDLFLNSLPDVAECIFDAIDKIVLLYLAILQIRKHREELKDMNVPSTTLKPLEQYEQQYVSKEINTIADKLFDKYRKKADKSRDKELRQRLVHALKYMAKRIDQGADFEITPPSELDEINEEEANEEQINLNKDKNMKIIYFQNRISSIKELPKRTQPILSLSEPKYSEEENQGNGNFPTSEA